MTSSPHGPLRVGIGGPVGTGKTTLTAALCRQMAAAVDMCVITNDIYTREDAEALMRMQVLPLERIKGVETGGCPHTAIREDCSINLAAIAEMRQRLPGLELVLIELGGDNLAATFSPDLADLTIYMIDVAQGGDIPRKGGPSITRSDLLVINKTDLAPHVGVDLDAMRADTQRARGTSLSCSPTSRAATASPTSSPFSSARAGWRIDQASGALCGSPAQTPRVKASAKLRRPGPVHRNRRRRADGGGSLRGTARGIMAEPMRLMVVAVTMMVVRMIVVCHGWTCRRPSCRPEIRRRRNPGSLRPGRGCHDRRGTWRRMS